MAEFRYQGVNIAGKAVQGVLSASSQRQARKRFQDIAGEQIRLLRLDRKATYIYKAQRGGEKASSGEQQAFCREEVEGALRKLNYRVIRVERKWLDFKMRPPSSDIVLFTRICADLLRQKLSYDDILNLLAGDVENKALGAAIQEIQQDLRDGKEGSQVFGKQAHTLGRFTAYMLGVASTSGNMAEVYESAAKFLERDEEFKKNLKSALIMPSVIILVLLGTIIFYVGYIFPSTAEMFVKFGIELPPMTRMTLVISGFLRSHMMWLVPVMIAPVVAAVVYCRGDKGRLVMHRTMIRLPVIGSLLHKTSIEIFARMFYALYSGSGENISVIRVAAEACRNSYMERRIKDIAIPLMLKEGRSFAEALDATGVFTPTAISRFRSGQEAGALRHTALQLADYYERETSYKMKSVVETVNVAISMLIMVVMIGLTLVSSETALIKPKNPLMM
jgi:type IV pilus assembly protein PilC